jgi:hypothetical protein
MYSCMLKKAFPLFWESLRGEGNLLAVLPPEALLFNLYGTTENPYFSVLY